jgi:hypothetical protein
MSSSESSNTTAGKSDASHSSGNDQVQEELTATDYRLEQSLSLSSIIVQAFGADEADNSTPQVNNLIYLVRDFFFHFEFFLDYIN